MAEKIILEKEKTFLKEEIPEDLKKGYELSLKAHQLFLDGRTLDAIALFEEALKLFQQQNAYKEMANVLEALGDIYILRGNFKKGLQAYKACLDICENFEDEISCAIIAEKIVHVYRQKREYEKMLPYLYRILEIAEKYKDPHRAARAMVGIGDAKKAKGDFSAAKEAYEIALKIYEGMGALELAKIVKNGLSQLEEAMKNS